MNTIDWLPRNQIPELQAFIDAQWRKGHILARDADLLSWQHARDDETLSILVARSDDEIQGMLGMVLVDFNVRGQKLPGIWLALWVARPGSNVGLPLFQHALGLPAAFVGILGVNETAMRIYRTLKFTTLDDVPRMVRMIDAHAVERLGCRPIEQPFITAQENGMSVRRDMAAWDEAWQTTFAPRAIGTWRGAAWLERRYLSHPTFLYHVLHAVDAANRVCGCLVYRLIPVAGHDASVVRILELMGQPDAMRALARYADNVGRIHGAAFVEFYGTHHDTLRACEAAGYVREQADPRLPSLFSPLDHRRQRLTLAMLQGSTSAVDFAAELSGPQLMVTRGDGDQDRPN
jgi:hypothetical protein